MSYVEGKEKGLVLKHGETEVQEKNLPKNIQLAET